jgi:phosphatidylglycerophosphate synthase
MSVIWRCRRQMCLEPNQTPHKNTSRTLAVLNTCHPGAWERVGGIPLTARTLLHLKGFGIKKVILLLGTERIPVDLNKWQGSLLVQPRTANGEIPTSILSIIDLGPTFVYIDAAHLIDPRLIYALTVASEPTLAYINASDREKLVIRAGSLRKEDLHIWATEGTASLIRNSRSLFPGDVDPFRPEIRGNAAPYFIEVYSNDAAKKATWTLIRSQQNQVMDLPAQFIDPPFENALTRLLCNTPITPNMVTLTGVVISAMIAWLFWHGYFITGAFCTFLVEILDGVDGKLARTKLLYSKLGQHEDVIDYFCENSWYVALAMGLRTFVPTLLPWMLAALLILSDTVDNILYTVARKSYGRSIDLFSPFDAAFRRIAGRRNIYGILFVFGFLLGYPLYTFAVVAVWAAMTAATHGLRLFIYGRTVKKKLSERTEGF